MKKTIAIFTIAAMFVACKNTTKQNDQSQVLGSTDTTGLAAFKQYKEQQRIIEQQKMFQTEGVYDGTNNFATSPNSIQTAPVRERIVYVDRPVTRRATATRTRRASSNRSYGYSNGNGTYASTPVPARKRGWSKAAKGAVIGGASGAVVGAVVSKKKGKGAIIGGALGALGGYVIGRGADKRDGRY